MGGLTKTKFGIQRETRFTNAQVLAWPTTGLTISPPAPPGTLILPHYFVFNLNPWFANYTNIDPLAELRLLINGQSSSEYDVAIGSGGIPSAFLSIFLAFGSPHFDGYDVKRGDANPNDLIGFPVVAAFNNQASGNLTGGDPRNVLSCTFFYQTI